MNEDFPVDDSLVEPSFGKAQQNKLLPENICLRCNNSIVVKRAIIVNFSKNKDKHKDVVEENTRCYCNRDVLREFIASTDDTPIVECQLFYPKRVE